MIKTALNLLFFSNRRISLRNLTLQLICCLYFSLTAFCKTPDDELIKVLHEQTIVDVHSMKTYDCEQVIEGLNLSSKEETIGFRVSQSGELKAIEVSVTINGKTKKLNTNDCLSISTLDWSAFFTGSTIYRLRIPASCDFRLYYKTRNAETIFLSRLSKSGAFEARESICRFNLPEDLILTTDDNRQFYGQNITFDSTAFAKDQATIYYLIHPKTDKPEQYFSNWFQSRIEPLTAIDSKLLPTELEQLNQTGNRTKLAEACFKYVRNEIRYVDIENGIHAIVPRPGNQTLINKFGDCKDMATLLYSLLRHYDFEAYLSVSRTFTKKDTFNFPAVGMANHMIVTLLLNGEYVFLDATEDECLFGDPSVQILGTEVFLINRTDDYFVSIPRKLKHKASVSLGYHFHGTPETGIDLSVTIESKGKLNSLFYDLSNHEALTKEKVSEYVEMLFPFPLTIDTIYTPDTSTTILFHAKLPVNSWNRIGNNCYIDAAVLPDIVETAQFFSGLTKPAYTANYSIEMTGIKPPAYISDVPDVSCFATSPNKYTFSYTIDETTPEKENDPIAAWKKLTSKPLIFMP